MRLHTWLDEEAGRATRMAEMFGVTVSAVSQWRTTGAPVKYLRRIVKATKGTVKLEDLLAVIEERSADKPQAVA